MNEYTNEYIKWYSACQIKSSEALAETNGSQVHRKLVDAQQWSLQFNWKAAARHATRCFARSEASPARHHQVSSIKYDNVSLAGQR